MRKYTLVFSIFAHAVAVGALIVVPALATGDLPEPLRTSSFVIVKPELPPPVSIARPERRASPTIANPVPLTPPDGVQPEPLVEPLDLGAVELGEPLSGVPLGDVVSTGDPIPPPPVTPRPKEPVRVGGRIETPRRLAYVEPIYPPLALAAHKEGLVILEALIGEDGVVRQVRVLRPAPMFEQAAITAVRQWRFSPTRLNGEPVPIVMTVTVGFTLTN